MPSLHAEQQRRFALEVLETLRQKGFEAYWAGGCVRDQLLGRTPKDYDVATNATPPEIRKVFHPRRRTLAIGAAFGVITVLGPKAAGQVEVTTFRQDAAYRDGRHPDCVTFTSAREDAARRDFTINGVFFDPIQQQVIDYVGGQDDLRRNLIRAIGDPRQRFAEDKLRMLRAVRFAAAFGFQLEAQTLAAIHEMADQIAVVSPERIAAELRRMLVDPGRRSAIEWMLETGLARTVAPEIVPMDATRQALLRQALAVLDRLQQPSFPLALAALLQDLVDPAAAQQMGMRWRLSNRETDRVVWLLQNRHGLRHSRRQRWSALHPLLTAEGIDDLLALHEAQTPDHVEDVAYCRALLEQPPEVLDPSPLITGDDLLRHGIPPGPQYRMLLQQVRVAQLDQTIHTRSEAMALVDRLRNVDKPASGSEP